jgi:AcrR family transcriptional regulator
VDNAFARAPKQSRSRQSYDRMLDAAAAIIDEGGLAALTLSEVSRRSKVSIGSIYCRVEGKEALLRAVQARTLAQMDREFALMLTRVRRKEMPLRQLIPALVRELALFLRRHARLLGAFMQQAPSDPVIEAAGRKSWLQAALDFKLILLERRTEIRHPDPEHAAEMCFNVVYGCLARFLGLGSTGNNEVQWNDLVEDLGLMMVAFLVLDLELAVQPPNKD